MTVSASVPCKNVHTVGSPPQILGDPKLLWIRPLTVKPVPTPSKAWLMSKSVIYISTSLSKSLARALLLDQIHLNMDHHIKYFWPPSMWHKHSVWILTQLDTIDYVNSPNDNHSFFLAVGSWWQTNQIWLSPVPGTRSRPSHSKTWLLLQ